MKTKYTIERLGPVATGGTLLRIRATALRDDGTPYVRDDQPTIRRDASGVERPIVRLGKPRKTIEKGTDREIVSFEEIPVRPNPQPVYAEIEVVVQGAPKDAAGMASWAAERAKTYRVQLDRKLASVAAANGIPAGSTSGVSSPAPFPVDLK